MAELHILNGDCALGLWKKCNFNAQSLVWKETYIEGPLPATDDLILFRQARAKYLATFAELSGIDEKRLCRHLQAMDDAIISLPENSTVMLWFDSCIFDQTILMRILYLLQQKNCTSINVNLYCFNSNCLTENDFKAGMTMKKQLTRQDLALAGSAWNLYVNKDASGMKQLSATGCFERLPALQKALLRCAEEIPGVDGLNRTQRQILQLINDGKRSFTEIFNNLRQFEEYPFLGDTACQRYLDQLVADNRLALCNREYFPTQEITTNQFSANTCSGNHCSTTSSKLQTDSTLS